MSGDEPELPIPRVVVDVAPGEAGWRVEVTGPGLDVPAYAMRAVAIPDEPRSSLRGLVPAVPAGRPVAADPAVRRLCEGDAEEARRLAERLATGEGVDGDVTTYGRWLFECLLAPAWDAIRVLPAVVEAKGVELALRWPVEETALHPLTWEAMHDGKTTLAGHRRLLVAVTRLVPVAVPLPPTDPLDRPPRMLLAAGTDFGDPEIRPGMMFMGLMRALEHDGLCAPRIVQNVTVYELTGLCRAFRPDVVQVVAHGEVRDGRGMLDLADSNTAGPADAEALRDALTRGGNLRVAVLSACRSGIGTVPLAWDLVAGGIPVVVAMTGDVSEPACRLFTRRWLESVHDGTPFVQAAANGRRAAMTAPGHRTDRDLEWAMPALFLADSLPSDLTLVDRSKAGRIGEIARHAELVGRPVYIGRRHLLDLADRMLEERLGFLGLVRSGTIERLGGTRLLREFGLRLLHHGHLPLMMGPYNTMEWPQSLRAVIGQILQTVVRLARAMPEPGLTPKLRTLWNGMQAPLTSSADLWTELKRWNNSSESLIGPAVREHLAEDLDRFAADVAGALGPPFGAHTRPVILCDELHRWEAAHGDLLPLIEPAGLGRPGKPIPVVATASLSGLGTFSRARGGDAVKAFVEDHAHTPGYRIADLEPLSGSEAALGYQWALLHPWKPNQKTYTFRRDVEPTVIESAFAMLEGEPKKVQGALFDLILSHLIKAKHLDEADDADALRQYERLYR